MSHSNPLRTGLFPAGFAWGVASSSYQIEGCASAAHRGPSIWDAFCRTPGAVHDGHTGEVACDHVNRYREDVQLMCRMGLRAYRFSVSWPRVMPDGVGPLNTPGLEFYDRLVDDLLAGGIEPWITLYHWDLPQALYLRGGWLNRESADWFAAYAAAVVRRLGDRVTHWMTFNEPQIFIGLGMGAGTHAPGLKLPIRQQLLAAHHTLLAHGRGVQAIRASAAKPCAVGWAPAVRVEYPVSEQARDVEAARRLTLGVLKKDMWNTAWFADPIYFGRYPEDGLALFGDDVPMPAAGDMELIRQPIDFLGVNIYSGTPVMADARGEPAVVPHAIGCGRNSLNWPIAPAALRWGPRFLWERYGSPIVVTENGLANLDWVDLDGCVRDPQRIDFTRRYLLELERAIGDGVDVRGYFHWSIMDNFEWAEGYKERFGLIHVDFATQQRTLKDSAYWYRAIILSNGQALALPPERAVAESRHSSRPADPTIGRARVSSVAAVGEEEAA